MSSNKKLVSLPIPWFTIAIIGIFLFSAVLRFWRIGQFNTLVFDETYYVSFADNYFTGTSFFNPHPPLGQYIITIGIWIGDRLPFGQDITNTLTGSEYSTFSYRWLNAFAGSFIPLIIGAIAYQLTQRRTYTLISAFFVAFDGFFLVESCYALTDIYIVIFGLLGQLFLLLILRDRSPLSSPPHQGGSRGGSHPYLGETKGRWKMLTLSGIFLGASASVKWNGLGFLLGIYLIWAAAWIMRWLKTRQHHSFSFQTPLRRLTQLHFFKFIWYFGIIPIITYSLSWIPHLLLATQMGFFQVHQRILSFHEELGGGAGVHPYCSRWYSWLIMWRPISYYYQTSQSEAGKVIYDVHAMGNPILWWLSTAAILLLLVLLALQLFRGGLSQFSTLPTWIALFLVLNYAANFLPWAMVSRCTFLYHYMEASIFAELGLAWIVDHWLRSRHSICRSAGIAVILAIIGAFFFWLPIYLGLPLSPEGYQLRMWFPSWV